MYKKITKDIRREVSKITLEQQQDLLELYSDVIKELAKEAKKSGDKSLTKRWIVDYRKQLMQSRKDLKKELSKQIKESIIKSSNLAVEGQQLILKGIFEMANIETSDSFSNILSKVNDNVIKDIISGNLYKDNKSLSDRIWNYGKEFEKDLQYTINKAMLEKKSAIELAKDVEKYVLYPAKRDYTWGTCYPNLKNKRVDYNAMRLARTSINHAYQNATVQSSQINPFVTGIQWESALIHGRTCELCKERHGKVYTKSNVPLDHPNGLCTMLPYIPDSLEDIATELRVWIDGVETNAKLDNWYGKYGKHFIDKTM